MIFCVVLATLVDPGKHFVDLSLFVVLHEVGAGTGKVMCIQPRSVKKCGVSLRSLFVETVHFAHHVVKIHGSHVFLEL